MKTTTRKRRSVVAEDALHRSMHALRERAEIAEKHQARLEKELPLMRAQNQRLMAFLRDAAAYIRVLDGTEDNVVLATLTRDINGLAEDKPGFKPRVTGYYEEAERKEKATSTV